MWGVGSSINELIVQSKKLIFGMAALPLKMVRYEQEQDSVSHRTRTFYTGFDDALKMIEQ